MKNTKVVVEQGEVPVEKPVLAQAIVDISKAVKALESSGLNRRAIVLLVSDKSKVNRSHVDVVLAALRDLEAAYCQTPARKKPR